MKAHYFTADVFTDQRFGGNQLAVFPDAREIASDLMPRIAKEFNYSETTFVLPPDDPSHTARVRIFTPGGELQFAGHPTVGTAHVLAATGIVPLTGSETRIVFEEGVGPVPVTIRANNGTPDFAQLSVAKLPEVGPPPPSNEQLAAALSLSPDDFVGGSMMPESVSCGTPFLFIPVRDRKVLARSRVKQDLFESALRGYVTNMALLFAMDPENRDHQIRARMYAPMINVPEDPATGSACVALGGYLANRDPRTDGTLRWIVEQGFEMGRPSILEVEVDKKNGKTIAARVGGKTVIVCEGEMEL